MFKYAIILVLVVISCSDGTRIVEPWTGSNIWDEMITCENDVANGTAYKIGSYLHKKGHLIALNCIWGKIYGNISICCSCVGGRRDHAYMQYQCQGKFTYETARNASILHQTGELVDNPLGY